MREIRFRAWDKLIGEMTEVVTLDLQTKNANDDDYYGMSPLINGEYVLMQYTGLKDKNGTEIYEGDVISVVHFTVETIPPYKAIIEWDKARFAERKTSVVDSFKYPYITPHGIIGPFNTLSTFGKRVEVIGNIYEHPHLIGD